MAVKVGLKVFWWLKVITIMIVFVVTLATTNQRFRLNVVGVDFAKASFNPEQEHFERVRTQYDALRTSTSLPLPVEPFLAYIDFQLGAYELGALEHEQAKQGVRPLIFNSNTPEYYLYSAVKLAGQGNYQASLNAFRVAYSLEPSAWPLKITEQYYDVLREYAYLTEHDDLAKKSESLLAYMAFPDTWSQYNLDSAGAGWRQFDTEFDIPGCGTAVALWYDTLALEAGPLVPIGLRVRPNNSEEVESIYRVVNNLVANAGFEWGVHESSPIGFESSIYYEDQPAITHSVVAAMTPNNELSQVASLSNPAPFERSSLKSSPIPVDASEKYFVSGLMKTDVSGLIGLGWYLRLDVLNPYEFASSIVDYDTSAWQRMGTIIEMPNVPSTDFVLINYESGASTQYDDMLFFPVDTLCD